MTRIRLHLILISFTVSSNSHSDGSLMTPIMRMGAQSTYDMSDGVRWECVSCILSLNIEQDVKSVSENEFTDSTVGIFSDSYTQSV
jgi:hypothetical protein